MRTRVLTLTQALGAEIMWYESKDRHVSEYARVTSACGMTASIFRIGFGYPILENFMGYKQKWRCWSKKPTEEQRESVPWREE